MNEILYDVNSVLIAGTLLVLMVLAIEIGYRFGRRQEAVVSPAIKDHINTVLGSMLGVLALLLAFSFSLAMERFDNRNVAAVEEANAIGTTYLRARLLPASVRAEVQTLLQRYTDLRLRASRIPFDRMAERDALVVQTNHISDTLWDRAVQAAEEAPNPVTTGLFIQSLNETIDNFGRRDAALRRHVPEVILFLLFGAFIATCGVVGYAAGVSSHRPAPSSYMLVVLIVLVCFIIIDLDRPRRGLIQVDQTSFVQLKATIDQAQAAQPPGQRTLK